MAADLLIGMNPKQFAARFVGAFIGVLMGELGTFPPFGIYFMRAAGARFPTGVEIVAYFTFETLVFVFAISAFMGKREFNLRNGLSIGFVYSLAIGLTFSGVLLTFNSYEPLYHVGAFLTWLINFTVGGALAGYLNHRVSK